MRVLVIGGNGFLGSHAVQAILEKHPDCEVHILSRRAALNFSSDPRIRYFQGNIALLPTLGPAFERVQQVVLSVRFRGFPHQDPGRGRTFHTVDVLGTQNVLRAATQNAVSRIVYLSRASAAQTSAPPPWVQPRLLAEKHIRESGLEFVILRPAWVYGPGDRLLARTTWVARHLPFMPVVGRGTKKLRPVSAHDAAAAIVSSLTSSEAANKTIELGGPDEIAFHDFIEEILHVLGRHRPLVHCPVWLAKSAAALCSVLPDPEISPEGVDLLLNPGSVDPEEAEKVLGMRFESLQEGLRRYI